MLQLMVWLCAITQNKYHNNGTLFKYQAHQRTHHHQSGYCLSSFFLFQMQKSRIFISYLLP